MTPDSNLVTAAISALVGCPVLTHDEYANNPGSDIQALDPEDFHNSVLVGPVERLDLILPPRQRQVLPHPLHAVREDSLVEVSDKVSCERSRPSRQATEIVKEKSRAAHDQGFNFCHAGVFGEADNETECASSDFISVFVKTLSGRTSTIAFKLDDSVDVLKHKIYDREHLDPAEQRLVYGGKQLDDGRCLRDYGVQADSTIHLALRIRGDIDDGQTNFTRGGEVYKRPCGWQGYALKMDGKYKSDVWLGSSNAPGEWPVSYHGTAKHNAASAYEGYKLSKSYTLAYGKGVYSSPNHATAEQYATTFPYNGRQYKVILQNRVNPANLYKVPTIDYWISPRDEDVRAYGICAKAV